MFQHFNLAIFPILKSIANPNLLKPDLILHNINSLTINLLNNLEITALIFDLDQTLCVYGEPLIYDYFLDRFTFLKNNFKTCVLSNAPSHNKSKFEQNDRLKKIEDNYSIKVIRSTQKKPNPQGYFLALDYLSSTPNNTLMVGDRLLTDILGAKLCGLKALLVEPISIDDDPTITIRLLRKLERHILMSFKGVVYEF